MKRSDTPVSQVERTCPRCGLVFLSNKLDGLCPACLLNTTLDIEDSNDEVAFWDEPVPARKFPERVFSHFELLDELGRGGMGVVYRARDMNTERIVALKVLQAHHLEVPDLVLRFRAEVRAVSSLDHPHILPIHEVGEHNSIPFFSMKLTTGGSLAQNLGRYLGKPREAAQLLAKVARGVQHAHERGILHRDIKPGNILIDAAGEPYVGDFGLAKWIDDDRRLTMTAAVLGTPHYIAPEQAGGTKALTTAVDIYSLGAILYELLTGRPPFVGTSVLETLMASREKTPERPSSITRHVPKDLETICLKALQHDPAARYATAGAFADDMESWLAGRSIQARPANAVEQLWRWAKRNPLPATLVTALMVTICVIAAGAVIAAFHIEKARKRAVLAEADAQQKLHQSLLAQAHAWRLTGRIGQRTSALAALRQAAQIAPDLVARNEAIAALTLPDAEKIDEFNIREYGKLGVAFNPDLTRAAVGRQNFSVVLLDLSTKQVLRTFQGATSPIRSLSFGGNRYLAGSTANDTLYIWKLDTGELMLKDVECRTDRGIMAGFSFDESGDRLLIFGHSKGCRIYSPEAGKDEAFISTTSSVRCATFDHQDMTIALVTEGEPNVIRLFDRNGKPGVDIHTPFNVAATTLAWSGDDRLLAAGCVDARTYVLDLHSRTLRATLSGHRQEVTQVLFADEDRLVVTTALDGSIRFWSLDSGSEQLAITEYGVEPVLRLNKDGTRLAATDFALNAAIFKIVRGSAGISATLPPEIMNDWAPLVAGIDFSADSQLLAVSSFTGIRIFDTNTHTMLGALPFSHREAGNLHFEGSDHLIVATTDEGLRRLAVEHQKDSVDLRNPEIISADTGFILGSLPAGKGSEVALTSKDGQVHLFDSSANRITSRQGTLPNLWDYIISPAGWEAGSFADSANAGVEILSHKTRAVLHRLNAGRSGTLTLSPNGQELLTTGERGCLLWKISSEGVPVGDSTLLLPAGRAAFSSDGNYFATCAYSPVLLYKTKTHELVATLELRNPPGTSFRLRFSPNGQYLAAQASNNFVQLWDLQTLNVALKSLSLNWE